MSHKKPIKIEVKDTLYVKPDEVFESTVVKSGNGAVIKAFKKHIGCDCIVIIKRPHNSQDLNT
jgi:putative transposon-encoded protein